jgi:ADP-heptose:LPS heptosyltransferase
MNPLVTISVVTHKALEYTQRCMESILKHTARSEFKLVITDNASGDDTVKYLKTLADQCELKIVENPKNVGFIPPHNAAFAQCDTPYFLVLNNDVTVCKDWIRTMLAEFERDPLVVSCGIRNTCIALNDIGHGVPGREAEYIEGSCMMVNVKAIQALPGGLFDTVYKFGYYEDSDLGLRVRKAGHRIAVVDIPVIHVGAATSRIVQGIDLKGFQVRNHHVFMRRWGGYLKHRILKPITKDRIVVRRGGAQGDVILATPVIHALRVLYPMSSISVQTSCKDVFDGNPDVNEVSFVVPEKQGDYLINLDMAYESDPDKHIIQAYCDAAKITLPDEKSWKPTLYPNQTARIVAKQRMPDGHKYAVIHPGAIKGWVGRQWPWKRLQQIMPLLDSFGYTTVLVGTQETPSISARMDYRNVPFNHLLGIMERASLFVGLDSMPFHVAQAFGTRSVVLFGSIDPALRVIPGAPVIPVTAEDVGCLGCHHFLPAPRTVTGQCVRGNEMCMEHLTVDQVMNAVAEIDRKYPLPAPSFPV